MIVNIYILFKGQKGDPGDPGGTFSSKGGNCTCELYKYFNICINQF